LPYLLTSVSMFTNFIWFSTRWSSDVRMDGIKPNVRMRFFWNHGCLFASIFWNLKLLKTWL